MAINTIHLAEKMTGALEKAIVQSAVTGFMADNVLRAKFVGAKTVLIPYMDLNGLGDYDRDDGFVQGSITVDNYPLTLTMDRGRTFHLDYQDNDESGVTNLAGQVMGELIRTQVVPELDAYVLSKAATHAVTAGQTVTGNKDSEPYKIFTDAANAIWGELGYDRELVAFVDPTFQAALERSPEFTRSITINEFKQGGVNLRVKSINGITLRPVTAARMKTAYRFNDGATSGQEIGGFTPVAGAQNVGLLMMDRSAGQFVKKAEKVRIFTPEVNQKLDAWKFDMRIYYDAFIKNNLKKGVEVFTYA